jgi:dTDP-4-amino-4,6-dideoxygalactose transaminase
MIRMGQEEIDAITRVIQSKKLFRINDGLREVEHFELELAEKFGVDYALCLNGGSSALTCGLIGLGIGPGDEVIIPAYTFIATAAAVLAVGAIPVLAEVDETMTIDLNDIRIKLRPTVKAVIPVDMVGFPCQMQGLLDMSREFGFGIIEDSCQAVGGSFGGKRLGTWGDAGCLSFNDYKIISAGEGGAMLTNNRKIYERALIYHNGGSGFQYYTGPLQEPSFVGSQCRVGEITGAVLRVQLQRLDGILTDLRLLKSRIISELAASPGARFIPSHDAAGDCGLTVGLAFDSAAAASRFAELSQVKAWLPINSNKHVYHTWDTIQKARRPPSVIEPVQYAAKPESAAGLSCGHVSADPGCSFPDGFYQPESGLERGRN